ncbi:MAG: hypothetical protein FWG48_02690 [Oscillospiraceae bacterium]|nr:hypothetical protein [Oscillospiraceae bacterium]
MIALAVVLAVLLLLALLRIGVAAEYGPEGLKVSARVGPLSIRVIPRKEKQFTGKKAEKAAAKKAMRMRKRALKKQEKKEKKAREAKQGAEKPATIEAARTAMKAVKKALGRLRRRLLIKRLIIRFTSAGGDPMDTAVRYGQSVAVINAVKPVLVRSLRIRRCDLRSFADFQAESPVVYINAAISIAVWEVLYVAIALLPLRTAFQAKAPRR